MCPVEIVPFVPVHISKNLEGLTQAEPTSVPQLIKDGVYVLPSDRRKLEQYEDYIVYVNGHTEMVQTQRLSSGPKEDDMPLVTPDEPNLSTELGVNGIIIDRVLYVATNTEGAYNLGTLFDSIRNTIMQAQGETPQKL